MTDLDTIRAMLRRAKITYAEKPTSLARRGLSTDVDAVGVTLIVTAGYADFYSNLTFDAAGALASIEAYE